MADEKKINHQAVLELVAVCEEYLRGCDMRAKKYGLVNIEKNFPIYRPMKKAIENINS